MGQPRGKKVSEGREKETQRERDGGWGGHRQAKSQVQAVSEGKRREVERNARRMGRVGERGGGWTDRRERQGDTLS